MFGELKPKYFSKESCSIEFDVVDDSEYVNITMTDETNELIASKLIYTNGNHNKSFLNFTMPDYVVGSFHYIKIAAYDEFNFRSQQFEYGIEVDDNHSPDIELAYQIPTFYKLISRMEAIIRLRDYDGPSECCFYTSVNSLETKENQCFKNITSDWKDYRIFVQIPKLDGGIHHVKFFAIDEWQGQSNKLIHYFGIVKNIECGQTCAAKVASMKASYFYAIVYIPS